MALLVVKAGCPVEAAARGGDTALHLAAAAGRTDLVRALLGALEQVPADGRHRPGGAAGYTPLHLAAAGGHAAAVVLLLSAGAPVNRLAGNG